MAAAQGVVQLGAPESFPKLLGDRMTFLSANAYNRKEHCGLCNTGILYRDGEWCWGAAEMFAMPV